MMMLMLWEVLQGLWFAAEFTLFLFFMFSLVGPGTNVTGMVLYLLDLSRQDSHLMADQAPSTAYMLKIAGQSVRLWTFPFATYKLMDWFPIILFFFLCRNSLFSSQLMVWRRQTMHFPWLGYIGMILRGSCGDFGTDWHRTTPICSVHVQSWFHPFHPMAGWWFGTWHLFFHILGNIGNNIPKWLSYFSEGWLNRQPDGFVKCFEASRLQEAPRQTRKRSHRSHRSRSRFTCLELRCRNWTEMKTDPLRIGARTGSPEGRCWQCLARRPGVDVRMTTVYVYIVPAVHDCSIQRAKQ